ncbi:MAG: tRNA pseudouridine(55) synthase TruB [Desulfonatronovibrionaceae bacterium]
MKSGVIVLNKPSGPTSAWCLNQIKKRFALKKIGHAGTLDPMASGVLVVLIGQATKIADYIVQGTKTYYGELRLGLETDTYDVQGTVISRGGTSGIQDRTIIDLVSEWKDLTSQEVPPVSAAKHKGRPLYKLHRSGLEVPVKTKNVKIFRADVIKIDIPLVCFRVVCSAGTYIRSLAHSLGKRAGCKAALSKLIREQSLPFSLQEAVDLDLLLKARQWQEMSLPLEQALAHWPRLVLDAGTSRQVLNGMPVPADQFPDQPARPDSMALMVDAQGQTLALARLAVKEEGKPLWTVKRVLRTNSQ